MTNKKFYIFLFICFFLTKKTYSKYSCNGKNKNSNKFFEEETFPVINIKFKNKLLLNDIYYNSYFCNEKEKNAKDYLIFFYGKPPEAEVSYFCANPNFYYDIFMSIKESKDRNINDLSEQDGVFIIDDKFIDRADLINNTTEYNNYYVNGRKYEECEYFLFRDNGEYRMYKKLLADNEERTKEYLKNVNFIIPDLNDKKKTNVEKINKIQLKGNSSNMSVDMILVIEFYLKKTKETITAKIYRKQVLDSKKYVYSCDVFYNGVSINDGPIDLINKKNEEDSIFEINNIKQ